MFKCNNEIIKLKNFLIHLHIVKSFLRDNGIIFTLNQIFKYPKLHSNIPKYEYLANIWIFV